MKKGIAIIALLAWPVFSMGQSMGATGAGAASRARTPQYGPVENFNPALVKDFSEYRFLVDYNIFSSKRGEPIVEKKPDPTPTQYVAPTPPPPREKQFVLTGISNHGDEYFAYIEFSAENSKYITPVGVNERVGSGLGVVTSITLDGIEYLKNANAAPISISVGYDLTGEPAGFGMRGGLMTVVNSSLEEAMKARRIAEMHGYATPTPPAQPAQISQPARRPETAQPAYSPAEMLRDRRGQFLRGQP